MEQKGTLIFSNKQSWMFFFSNISEQADVDPSYKKIWNYMDTSRPLSMVQDVDEGYKRVLRGDYAFMWDYPVLMYQKKKHCELATVGKPFNRKNYAFALPKNAAYLESITLSILGKFSETFFYYSLFYQSELDRRHQSAFFFKKKFPETNFKI